MMSAAAKVRPLPIPEGRVKAEIRQIAPRKGMTEGNGMLIRVSKEERELIKKAARSVNETAAYFALRAMLERATKVLQD